MICPPKPSRSHPPQEAWVEAGLVNDQNLIGQCVPPEMKNKTSK